MPTATLARFMGPAATLRPKYPVDLPATSPYLNLLLGISTRLSELGEVSWARYQQADDAQLLELAAAVDQYANLLADLMSVDGAVVLTKQLAVVGFGIEVYAPQLVLPQVYRALDAAATQLRAEPADQGGTRHRAAYRLCRAEPESMAIVVSQDGGVRFVHAQADKVIFLGAASPVSPPNLRPMPTIPVHGLPPQLLVPFALMRLGGAGLPPPEALAVHRHSHYSFPALRARRGHGADRLAGHAFRGGEHLLPAAGAGAPAPARARNTGVVSGG